MEQTLVVISGTVAIYLALFVLVAVSPKVCRKLIAGIASATVVIGLAFYGFCLSTIHPENPLLATIKTCHAVLLQFLGSIPEDLIKSADIMGNVVIQILIRSLCFLGVFSTTGAALSTLGAGLLRKLRVFCRRKNPVAIVHPLNANTLEFAQELVSEKGHMVVFVDAEPEASCLESAAELGCVIRSDKDALQATPAFLRSLGLSGGNRPVTLYALSDDRFTNRQYAIALQKTLQECKIPAAQASLTLLGEEDETQSEFLRENQACGFGNVLCVNEAQMAARLLMHHAPVWDTVSFDADGRATEDFHALVVGSGKAGQAVIKQLVMNGQFAGSRFRLTVFDPRFHAVTGRMRYECPQLFENYPIDVHTADARSAEMYGFLAKNCHTLRYIVICSGNDHANSDICQQLQHFLRRHQIDLPLYICSSRGLRKITTQSVQRWPIFTSRVLCSDELDTLAMLLNHSYCGNEKTPRENWAACDYFSRMSSRASADYAPGFLKMLGLSQGTIPAGDWITPQQLENLAISEHERWCAFHYCMGFRAMTDEEFARRSRIYQEEKAKNPASRYRIGKDLLQRVHCCLVPWESLDALSAKENAVTGGHVDYKAMDRNNVLTLPALLQSAKDYKG